MMDGLQHFLPPVVSGMIFGGSLTLAGVATPRVVINQLKLTDFHMLLAYMSASACSAVIIAASNAYGYAKLGSRKDSSYGWFGKYDGNIIGGALQGVGMALTGACPGTVLVQAAAGLRTSYFTLLGGIFGGIAYVRWRESAQSVDAGPRAQHTIMQKTGLSTSATVLGYEILLLATIAAAHTLAPRENYWLSPIVGGALIGAAQATSVVFSKKTLGVSSAYEDAGKAFWATIRGKNLSTFNNTVFAAAVCFGAYAAMSYAPATKDAMWNSDEVSHTASFAGGCAMIFGGRLAGGCTSGHGISGMATMAMSSFITVAAMFGAGIATALLV